MPARSAVVRAPGAQPQGRGSPGAATPSDEGGSRTQGPGDCPQRERREPGRFGGGLWLFLAEPGRPPEAFLTFQKFLGTGGRWGGGTPYIDRSTVSI